jgi:hypothetical protein
VSSEQEVGTTLLTFQCAGRDADVFFYCASNGVGRALLSPEGVAALSRVAETISEEELKALRQRRSQKLEGAAALAEQEERLAALPPQCVNYQPVQSERVLAKKRLTRRLPELSHPVKDLRPEDLLPEGYAIASYKTGKSSSTGQLFKQRCLLARDQVARVAT